MKFGLMLPNQGRWHADKPERLQTLRIGVNKCMHTEPFYRFWALGMYLYQFWIFCAAVCKDCASNM